MFGVSYFGVEYQNCHQTLNVYLFFGILLTRLQTCHLQTGQFISYKYVNQFRLNLPNPNSKKTTKVRQLFRQQFRYSRPIKTF